MRRSATTVCAIGVIVLAAGTAWARPPGFGMAMAPPGMMMGEGPGGLPLPVLIGVMTDEQRKELPKLMDGQREAVGALKQQLDAAHQELSDKLLDPKTTSVDDLRPQIDRIAKLRQQMIEQGLAAVLQLRGMLSPDQLAQARKNQSRLESIHEEVRTLLGPMPAPPPE